MAECSEFKNTSNIKIQTRKCNEEKKQWIIDNRIRDTNWRFTKDSQNLRKI